MTASRHWMSRATELLARLHSPEKEAFEQDLKAAVAADPYWEESEPGCYKARAELIVAMVLQPGAITGKEMRNGHHALARIPRGLPAGARRDDPATVLTAMRNGNPRMAQV